MMRAAVTGDWQLRFEVSEALPPLAWIARVSHGRVHVRCGSSVRTTPSSFFSGSWSGGRDLEAVLDSTTTFGSGLVARDGYLWIVPPAHTLEGVFRWHEQKSLLVANSLVGLLEAADLELLPGIDYVSRFLALADGLGSNPIRVPVSRGEVMFDFYENLRIDHDLTVTRHAKPREPPFASYEDYFTRIDSALGSLLSNAPGYRPIVTISSGYDSTAMAVLAARHGCRQAVTFAHARPPLTSRDSTDSGEGTAQRLGMDVAVFDRLAYRQRTDSVEAEFLATGYTGEDVFLAPVEPLLRRTVFINGGVGAAMWRLGRLPRNDMWRLDLSGCSMTEFKLRVDFIDVPLPVFGMAQNESLQRITESTEMAAWSVGGYYDRPIPRRMAEEAGIPRGSFGTVKRAATALVHLEGEQAMSDASVEAAKAFAERSGTLLDLRARRMLPRWKRFLVRAAHVLRLTFLVQPIQRQRRRLIHFPAGTGSLLLRWAVEQLRPRYTDARGRGREPGGLIARSAASTAAQRDRDNAD